MLDHVTFPLAFALYKPKTRLKPGDRFQTKPELALALIQQLLALGFRFEVVLADTVYGDNATFINALHHLGLRFVVAIRSNHSVWMEANQRIRTTRWRAFEQVFSDGSSQERSLRETVFGRRRSLRYFQITTDPVPLPPESTWLLMTNLPGKIEQSVGNTFGLRTWIEYGFKQAKDELGWADYRLTDAPSIRALVGTGDVRLSVRESAGSSPGARPHRPSRTRVSCRCPAASRLDGRCQLETPAQQPPTALATLRLYLSPAAQATSLSLAPPHGWLGRLVRAHEHPSPAVPNMTNVGLGCV